MTDLLPPPSDDGPPPPGPAILSQPSARRAGAVFSTIICWAIILICVSFVLVHTTESSGKTAAGNAVEPDNPTLPLVGRMGVGIHEVAKWGGVTGVQGSDDSMLQQLDTLSVTPQAKLRVATVYGEIRGADAARKRLVPLEDDPAVGADARALTRIYQGKTLDADQQRHLENAYDWFGRLALSFGKSDDDPLRKSVIHQAIRTMITLEGFGIAVGLFGIVGLTLAIVAIVRYIDKKWQFRFYQWLAPGSRSGAARTAFLEAFTIYLAGFFILAHVLAWVLEKQGASGLGWSLLLTILLPVPFVWPRLRGVRSDVIRQALGWHHGRGVVREMFSGIVGYLTGLPLLAILFGITTVLIRLSGATPSHPAVGEAMKGPGHVLILFLLACVWAPIMEETMFRGALFFHLTGKFGWVLSAIIVGLVFASIHPQGWTLIPMLGGIGFVLDAIRAWRGSIIGSMTAHALNNGTVLAMLVLAMG